MYYVSMTDTFMSNWGLADGKINKLVFLCDDIIEAHIVRDNANNRSDMEDVRVSKTKPAYYNPKLGTDYVHGEYYVQEKTKEDYPNWYKEGYFN